MIYDIINSVQMLRHTNRESNITIHLFFNGYVTVNTVWIKYYCDLRNAKLAVYIGYFGFLCNFYQLIESNWLFKSCLLTSYFYSQI